MIKTPLSTVIGGAFWTPGATIIAATFEQRMKKLFANGEQGFWYDPNDLSTMFQDAGGTVPVTAVGQPVGLVLDKSKGLVLGGELNSNNFNTNLAGWGVGTGASVILENGEAKATLGGAISATAGNWFKLDGNYNLGKRYTVSFDATYVSGGDLHAGFGYTVGLTVTAAQNGASKQRYTFTSSGIAATGSGLLAFGASTAGSVWKIDNVSVKEVLGNHAYQTTSASRPILRQNATTGAYYLEFDGVDDRLVTGSFPSMGLATTIFAGSRGSKAATSAVVARGVAGYVYQTSGQVTVQSVNNPVTLLQSGNTVITAKYAASGTGVTLKANNLTATNPATTDRGFGFVSPVVIGAFDVNGVVPFLGHIYSLIGVSRIATDEESIVIEREIAKRLGVTLSV